MPAAVEPAPAGVAQQASYASKYAKTGEALSVVSIPSEHIGLLTGIAGLLCDTRWGGFNGGRHFQL